MGVRTGFVDAICTFSELVMLFVRKFNKIPQDIMLFRIFKNNNNMKYKHIINLMYENAEHFTSIPQKSLVNSFIGSSSKQDYYGSTYNINHWN